MTSKIPKIVWMLWLQGFSEAPLVVRRCLDSWITENPDWKIILLDQQNLSEYISLDFDSSGLPDLPVTEQSNLVRLQLLSQYGGVWVDATTLCMKPLNDWLYQCTELSGFFAFSNPSSDRIMSNWFIASEPNNVLTMKLSKSLLDFFLQNKISIKSNKKRKLRRFLGRYLNKSGRTQYWFSPVFTRFLKIYPYFICHYLFERVVFQDEMCRQVWEDTKKISANGPHINKRHHLLDVANDEIMFEIDNKLVPVYKLTWKFPSERYNPSTLLYYLLEGRHEMKAIELTRN